MLNCNVALLHPSWTYLTSQMELIYFRSTREIIKALLVGKTLLKNISKLYNAKKIIENYEVPYKL